MNIEHPTSNTEVPSGAPSFDLRRSVGAFLHRRIPLRGAWSAVGRPSPRPHAHTPILPYCPVFCLQSLVFSLFLFPLAARANIVLGVSDWDANLDHWTNYYGWSQPAVSTTGGNTGGWLRVTFTNTAGPDMPGSDPNTWYDIAYTQASNIYAGAWTTTNFVQFDFWQSNVVAGGLKVAWKSSNINATVWNYALTPPDSVGGTNWTTFTASFSNWMDWGNQFASQEQYLSDLAGIDWIGVYIFRDTTDEQVYGIDNFKLMIPEPAEMTLLAVAIASSAAAWRRKRKKKKSPV